ncbi:MAG: hypothetical protein KF736_01885 [Acidobacteria bacterium]|nr:hypothetical protein [Acidobacteriota bacterium]MCW5948228.1 hypothetical protein [Pyrinomonadaceae bacterium]
MIPTRIATAAFAAFILAAAVNAQELPGKIRGYKVYDRGTVIESRPTGASAADGSYTSGEPPLVFGEISVEDVSASGVTLSAPVTLRGLAAKGEIHYISFRDVTVNGLPSDVEEYRGPVKIRPGEKIVLSDPIKFRISHLNLARAAFREMFEKKPQWEIRGTIFVFGRFTRLIFSAKRVVPVRLSIMVDNPLI